MTNSYVRPGQVLQLAAPYDRTAAGLGMKVGALFGVTLDAALETESVRCAIEGVHDLLKVGSQAWAVGDRIYWDDTQKYCTSAATAGMFIGVAVEAVGSDAGATTGTVKLLPGAELLEGNQGAVAALAGTLTGTATGTMVDVAAAACAGGATPTAAQVDTAIDSLETSTNLALKELQTKLNALLAKLVIQGLITAS